MLIRKDKFLLLSNVLNNKTKNILMLNYEFPPLGGGAGNATNYLLKEFSTYTDLYIDLITSSANEFKIERFSKNIAIHFLDIKKSNLNLHYQTNKDLLAYTLKSYIYARKLCKQKQYDLCHAFFGMPCGLIALILKLPYIVSLRGSDVPFYNRRFYWLDKLFFAKLSKKIWENAEKVVANSEDLKELAHRVVPNLDIITINNGVDIKKFAPSSKKPLNKKLKLISTGRLIERKGYKYLIEALKDFEQVELTLIGEGNMADSLKALAKKNNVDVNFLGRVKQIDLPDYLREADIFVLPSLNEGMSNSVLEAMACGLPVITTNTGGSKDLIKGNGYVVTKCSVLDLAKTIHVYLKDKSLIKTQGNLSRQIAQRMGWNNIAIQYERLYRQ